MYLNTTFKSVQNELLKQLTLKSHFVIAGYLGLMMWSMAAQAQNLFWATQLGDAVNDLVVDFSGNVYTTGYFAGTADFDPGVGTFNLTSAGNWDMFITKLDSSGNLIWAKKIGGSSFVSGISLSVDDDGNAYATGYFQGSADFDPGPGTFYLTSAGNEDVFISQIPPPKAVAWGSSP